MSRFLAFSYGMYPLPAASKENIHSKAILNNLKNLRLVQKGDVIIIAERRMSDKPGETDSMGVMTIE